MNGYTKLFGSLIHSTVWQKEPHVKLVWVTMLAMVNKDGVVEASVPGLAKAAGVTIEQTEEAIASFLAPDPYSRSKEAQGRRIETVDGGWWLINHRKYRELMASEERRERNAERMRTVRDRAHACEPVREVSHTDTDTDTDPDTDPDPKAEAEAVRAAPPTPPPVRDEPIRDANEIAIALQMRQHEIYRTLDAHQLAPMLSMRAFQHKKRIEWVLQAIDDCAIKSVGLGLKPEALQGKLVSFIRNASEPRAEQKPAKPPALVDDTDPAAVERIRRGPKRVTAQSSGLVPGSPEAIEAFVNGFGRAQAKPMTEAELDAKRLADKRRLAEEEKKLAGSGGT